MRYGALERPARLAARLPKLAPELRTAVAMVMGGEGRRLRAMNLQASRGTLQLGAWCLQLRRTAVKRPPPPGDIKTGIWGGCEV